MIQRILSAGALIGVGALLNARYQSRLARKAEGERESREALRRRLDAQHAALADFAAYSAKHLPQGTGWDDETRVEAVALITRVSAAYAAPTFAEGLLHVLYHVASWGLEDDGPVHPYAVDDLNSWVQQTKAELWRCITGTEAQLGFPEVKVQPLLPNPPKTRGERAREIGEHVPAALPTEKKMM